MTLQIKDYRENAGRVQVPFKTIGKIVTLCRDKIYSELESSERFDLDCVCSVSARNDVIPSSPAVLEVLSYAGKSYFDHESYLTLLRIEGDSLRENFEGLIKLLEEQK